ncbi:hypothetical protein EV360DRAFT_84657 [Lentinula raphanica]|nr:hypothetical protein EV360DRAFT_84657 [Lentinula raphanica]
MAQPQPTEEEHYLLQFSVPSEGVQEAFEAYQDIATDRARCSLETETAIGELREDLAKTLSATNLLLKRVGDFEKQFLREIFGIREAAFDASERVRRQIAQDVMDTEVLMKTLKIFAGKLPCMRKLLLEDPQLVWTVITPARIRSISSRSTKTSIIFRQLANPSLAEMYHSGDDCTNRLTGTLSVFFPHMELPVRTYSIHNAISRGTRQAISTGSPTTYCHETSKSHFPECRPSTTFVTDVAPLHQDERNTSLFQLLDHYRSGINTSHARTMCAIQGIRERMKGHSADEDAKSNALESHIEEFNDMFDVLRFDWDIIGHKCPTISGFSDSPDGSVALDFWLKTLCLSELWEIGRRLSYLGHIPASDRYVEANKIYCDLATFRNQSPIAEGDWVVGSDWEDHSLYTRLLDHIDQLLVENQSDISGASPPRTWAEEAKLLSLAMPQSATVNQPECEDINETSVIEALLAESSYTHSSNSQMSPLVILPFLAVSPYTQPPNLQVPALVEEGFQLESPKLDILADLITSFKSQSFSGRSNDLDPKITKAASFKEASQAVGSGTTSTTMKDATGLSTLSLSDWAMSSRDTIWDVFHCIQGVFVPGPPILPVLGSFLDTWILWVVALNLGAAQGLKPVGQRSSNWFEWFTACFCSVIISLKLASWRCRHTLFLIILCMALGTTIWIKVHVHRRMVGKDIEAEPMSMAEQGLLTSHFSNDYKQRQLQRDVEMLKNLCIITLNHG